MITVWDFLDMCTQDWIDIDLFNCDTGECIMINIADINEAEYEDIMNAQAMSWDIGDSGRICINYEY